MSDGYGSPGEYFVYARDVSGLDVAALTEHDFMLSDQDWARVKSACNSANATGEFVTIQAYEWSGSSEVGGDRNIYFRGDDPLICRSRSLYDHRNIHVYHGPDRGANHAEDLFRWLDETVGPEGTFVVPHWGGRPADPRWTDPRYERLVEICSEHQNSEKWANAFLRSGTRFGFVAGGDDHIGRPGNGFLAYGPVTAGSDGTGKGLIAVLARRDREAVYQALVARRVYATTGARILLDCDVEGLAMGEVGQCSVAPLLRADVHGTGPLVRVEALRDDEVVFTQAPGMHQHSIRLLWRDPQFLASGRECAYWFRAVQADGHLAVSSPVWLTPANGAETCQG